MATVALEASGPRRFRLGHDLINKPLAAISLAVIGAVVIVALLAPVIAPYNPNAIDTNHILAGPTSGHLLGTDQVGRDMLSRVILGTRTAIEIALPAVLIGFVPGLILGMGAGYLGGVVDKVATVIIDALLSLPTIIFALTLVAVLGPTIPNLILLLAIALIPAYARLARAQTLVVKQQVFVKAERALGASRARIMIRHVFPNIIPPLLVLMAMDIPAVIALEAGLAFLGVGLRPPVSDWGIMLSSGFQTVRTSAWPLIGPLVMITIVTTAFTIVGETLRDLMDPKYVANVRRRRFF